MKKSLMAAALVLSLGILVFSLAGASGPKLPPADGAALWTYISQTSPYTKWQLWPGQTGLRPGKSPHGAFVAIYANDIAIQAAQAQKPMPPGAIIVKENFAKDKKTLVGVTPMYRVKGYNPKGGDWFWGKYGPKGKVMAAGKPKGCVSCHTAVKDADWIFTKAK